MKVLSKQTEKAPLIILDDKELRISGRSYMSNAYDFYRNIIATIDGIKISALNVNICIDYFNTSSSKCILELFQVLEKKVKSDGAQIHVTWGYSQQYFEMLEAGEDYRDILTQLDFEIVEIK